jgi:hypothetical protein
LALGTAFHLGYQATEEDFSISIASSKVEGITSAQDLMKVNVKAEELRNSLDKTDIPLALSWYDTGFDVVSDVQCAGENATVNQDVRRLEFTKNGEVKVSFSITNAFGTFVSNELLLVCEDVVDVQVQEVEEKFYESAWFIALYFIPLAAVVAVGSILAIKKIKSVKKDK